MKKIEFLLSAQFPFNIPSPIPASDLIPEWWKQGEAFISKTDLSLNVLDKEDRAAGMKSCIPFLDGITSGYLLLTWADIEITENHNEVVKWQYVEKNENGMWKETESNINWDMVGERTGAIGHSMPRPAGYAINHLTWNSKWGIKVPKGWSVLITHPLSRFELPFITSSAIMDSDRFSSHGSIPFFIKKGWTGVIPKGTPYAHIIPIKRSSWISFNRVQPEKYQFIAKSARMVQYGFYRSKLWIPKKYKAVKNDIQ